MALKKTKTFAGYPFNYWKLNEIKFDDTTNRVSMKLCGYKDRDARLANHNSYIYAHNIVEPFSAVENWNQNPKNIGYALIKRSKLNDADEETNFWNDASDVLE